MAGTKGRSGRRQQFKSFEPSEPAPDLLPDYDSIAEFLRWVTAQHVAGNIDRADARELRDHAKAMSTVRAKKHTESELEEMRDLVRRAEEATQRSQALEVEQRYHADDGRDEPS